MTHQQRREVDDILAWVAALDFVQLDEESAWDCFGCSASVVEDGPVRPTIEHDHYCPILRARRLLAEWQRKIDKETRPVTS